MNPYRDLFRAMNEAGIHYLIVGGVAVNLHGHRRFTADVDILLALDQGNLEKMTKLMHSLQYVERLPIALQELNNEQKVKKLLEEKGMTAYTFLSNAQERIDVDVLASASLTFDAYDQHKVMIEIDDEVQVPVVSINDLISLKKEANRAKDIEDIQHLLELKAL